jgi:uncharacterized protein YndB with AHSA1/START domain
MSNKLADETLITYYSLLFLLRYTMFSHRYTHSIEIHATPAAVWRVLSDLSRLPEWYVPCQRVESLDAGSVRVGTQFVLRIRTAVGVELLAPGEILAVEHERLLKWRGRTRGIAATATWILTPQNGHTLLTHEFAGGGWMMQLSVWTGRAPKTALRRLEGLKKVVEGN